MLFEYFFIGLVVGFLYYELTGISPGGIIAPAYIALFILQPQKIIVTLLIALCVWIVIELASKYLIIYGRRRLLIAIIIGFCIKFGILYWVQPIPAFQFDLQSIGYIIPGLIANEMSRQKIIPTITSLGIVTILIYLIITLLGLSHV